MINCLPQVKAYTHTRRETLENIEAIIAEQNHKLFSILFQGPKVWNSLPNDIRGKPSLTSFKTNQKNVLLRDLE